MTDEDKKIIADYMKWCLHENWDNSGEPFDTGACLNCGASIFNAITRNFDLIDAGLCIAEMQKRGEWEEFLRCADRICDEKSIYMQALIAWLFVAENFFGAMAAWIKEGKK